MVQSFLIFMICSLVSLVNATAEATNTGTMGLTQGKPASVTCPNQTYLAGFNIWLKPPSFSGLTPYCASMASDGSWASGGQVYSDLMMSKGNGGTRLDVFCPFDFYVFGFQGYSMVYGINAIAQLTVTCKNAKTGATTSLFTPYPNGVSVTQWPARQCNNNSIAQGAFGPYR